MSWQETMETSTERSWKWAATAWLVLTPILFFVGFQQIFSTHADYDDEGYVMMSIVSYMNGGSLYDDTYTQYGPFFFGAQSLFHRLTALPVTHDVVRIKTLFVWMLSATVLMSFVFTETRSWRLSTIVYLLSFFHLERLCLEPGHPQEFCILSIVLSLWLAQQMLLWDATVLRRGLCAAALGAVIGSMMMVKLNVGLFLFVSAVLMMLMMGPKNRLSNTLLNLGCVGAVLLPVLMTQSHLRLGMGLALPIVCSCALIGIIGFHRSREFTPRVGFFQWFTFSATLALVLAASMRWAVSGGTSWSGLAHGIIGQHLGFKEMFFTPAPLHSGAVLVAIAFAFAAWRSANRRVVMLGRVAVGCAVVFAILQYLPESSQPLYHGMKDRGATGLLLGVVGPAMWLALYRRKSDPAAERVFVGRLPLVLFAALQPMQAYPTPGTQMAVGVVLMAIAGVLILRDLVEFEWRWLPRPELFAPGLAVLLCACLLVRGSALTSYRNSLTPLALPGAQLMRVPEEKAKKLQWLAQTLKRESSTFVFGENACCSYYFWAQVSPPTGLNPTFWPYLLRDSEEQRIIAALESRPGSVVVHQPFTPKLPDDSPLLKYLDEFYEPAFEHGEVEIWRRKPGANRGVARAGG